jgi:hypothetical protein
MQIWGPVHDIVVRNLTTKHVINDGFALNSGYRPDIGYIKENHISNIRYENIQAIDNGDDGLSAHGNCDIYVDGFVSIGNSTGIGTGGTGEYHRVYISDTHGIDIVLVEGRHVFKDCVVESRIAVPIALQTPLKITEPITMVMENCLIRRNTALPPIKNSVIVWNGSILEGHHVTFIGIGFQVMDGKVALADSFLTGNRDSRVELSPKGEWHGKNNIIAIGGLKIGDTEYAAQELATVQSEHFENEASAWRQNESLVAPAGHGADTSYLPFPHQ